MYDGQLDSRDAVFYYLVACIISMRVGQPHTLIKAVPGHNTREHSKRSVCSGPGPLRRRVETGCSTGDPLKMANTSRLAPMRHSQSHMHSPLLVAHLESRKKNLTLPSSRDGDANSPMWHRHQLPSHISSTRHRLPSSLWTTPFFSQQLTSSPLQQWW
jgi:hypothetical protein